MLLSLSEAISDFKGVLNVLNVFSSLKLSAHYFIIVDLQMLIDRPQHQNMRERENGFSQISIFMWLVVNGVRTSRESTRKELKLPWLISREQKTARGRGGGEGGRVRGGSVSGGRKYWLQHLSKTHICKHSS